MSEKKPPKDMPQFDSLGHEQTRALRVWFFLRTHHGTWHTVNEISTKIGLAESTVGNALSRIFGLPRVMRPFLQRSSFEDDEGKVWKFRCQTIIDIITED